MQVSASFSLPAWSIVTITPSADATGSVTFYRDGGNALVASPIAASTPVVLGPYTRAESVEVRLLSGTSVNVISLFDIAALDAAFTLHRSQDLFAAGVPTDTVTGANVSEIGARYTNVTTGQLYLNGGTKVSPVWKIVTRAV